MTICGVAIAGNVLALGAFALALCVLLVAGTAVAESLERHYERRHVLRRLRPVARPSQAPHVHSWRDIGAGRAVCDCGAGVRVLMGEGAE